MSLAPGLIDPQNIKWVGQAFWCLIGGTNVRNKNSGDERNQALLSLSQNKNLNFGTNVANLTKTARLAK